MPVKKKTVKKEVEVYETSDGQTFIDYWRADSHQARIDKLATEKEARDSMDKSRRDTGELTKVSVEGSGYYQTFSPTQTRLVLWGEDSDFKVAIEISAVPPRMRQLIEAFEAAGIERDADADER